MKDPHIGPLPEAFEDHMRVQTQGDEDCLICDIWEEPAWFWHADIAPPGTLAEQMAKVREDARLVGLEIMNLALRVADRAQRWLRGVR